VFQRAIEISVLGERSQELRGWRPVEQRAVGKLALHVLENPTPVKPSVSFLEAFGRDVDVFVDTQGDELRCGYQQRARVTAGGLPGPVAAPAQRFQCPGGMDRWVGLTVIDDQQYRPRQCLYAHPSERGPLVVRFDRVPLARQIYGYAGLSYLLMREPKGTPVTLRVRVDGEPVGSYEHHDEWGWHRFAFDLGKHAGREAEVRFEVTSPSAAERRFCFYADSR
jgi:hypothetical protein